MSKQGYLPADERRQTTVRAVVDLCAEDDPARITTGAIAQRMRVTQGALFRHFPSKEAIWEAVVRWVTERVMQRIEAAAEDTRGALPTLEEMFFAHIGFIAEHPGVPRLLVGQLQQHQPTPAGRLVRDLLGRYHQRVQAVLVEGQHSGEIAAELDVDAAATQYIGMIQGLVVQSLVVGDVAGIRNGADAVFAIYRRGIRAGASS